NEVPRDVDSNHFSSRPGERNGRGSVSAAQVQNPQRRFYPEGLNDYFSGLTHEGGNLGEVAFFPQCFVWINDVRILDGWTHCTLLGFRYRIPQSSAEPLQDYNCAMDLLNHPCPSVAIICSDGLGMLITLRAGQRTLQRVQRTEWMHSPKS